jgi:hypothetical protein
MSVAVVKNLDVYGRPATAAALSIFVTPAEYTGMPRSRPA